MAASLTAANPMANRAASLQASPRANTPESPAGNRVANRAGALRDRTRTVAPPARSTVQNLRASSVENLVAVSPAENPPGAMRASKSAARGTPPKVNRPVAKAARLANPTASPMAASRAASPRAKAPANPLASQRRAPATPPSGLPRPRRPRAAPPRRGARADTPSGTAFGARIGCSAPCIVT